MTRDADPNEPSFRAGLSYPTGQLQRALEAAVRQKDPALRQRAEQRALAWEQVIAGIASGTLQVGSRTPIESTPAWVTLEVAHGGFATGNYLAEGPMESWEHELLANTSDNDAVEASARLRLNAWHLSDEGLADLQRRLADGSYRIKLPEEGAFLVVAWLMANGYEGLALDLVSELYPLIDRLRFYPCPADRGSITGATVHLRTAAEVADQLNQIEVPGQVAAMRDALAVWNPLLDRLVALWLETVASGWPCQRWPDSWSAQRSAWLTDFEAAVAAQPASRHLRPRSPFGVMRDALVRCPDDSSALSARDVGRLRKAIKGTTERWGVPGDERHSALRRQQDMWASLPTHNAIATEVAGRLASYPKGAGIPDLAPVLDDVDIDGVGVAVPASLARKTERALEAPVDELVQREVIGSSEVLAQVLPQITSQVAAAGIDDRDLQRLYSQIYQAFRRRRSLLLLNLEHQVQIEELPWVAALDRFRAPSGTALRTAAQTLEQTALLAITSFPQTILPNPLVKELGALAKQAGLEIPFVEEVAADIFMGTFTTKWREAARIAADFLDGTIYARYYDLPGAATWARLPSADDGLVGKARLRWGKHTAEDFATICQERSREAGVGDGSFVARNGTVIEQSQILTTHNLAPLVQRLALSDALEPSAPHLASDIFGWIVQQQTHSHADWRSRLQVLKNTAYAWRQAIFLLSLADGRTQERALAQWRNAWSEAPAEWRGRFEPALAGLEHVRVGGRFDSEGRCQAGRRFLGWSVGPHWLNAPPE